jgi:SAM-dependent methyltransferase
MEAEEYFNLHAAGYAETLKSPLVEYQRSLFHELLAQYIEPHQTILDVGCGPGSDFDFYKSLGLQVDAIDTPAEMLKYARKQSQRLGLKTRIARSSLENFIPDVLYDIIILNFGLINTIKDFKTTMEKIKKILNTDGTIFIVCRPPFHLYSLLEDKLHLRFRKLYLRYFKRQTVIDNELTINFYSAKDFQKYFDIERSQHYCALISTPEQFTQSAFARFWTKKFINLDKKYLEKVPGFLGGDYICYVLKNKKSKAESKTDVRSGP